EAAVFRALAVDEGHEDLLECLGLFPGELAAGTEAPQHVVVLPRDRFGPHEPDQRLQPRGRILMNGHIIINRWDAQIRSLGLGLLGGEPAGTPVLGKERLRPPSAVDLNDVEVSRLLVVQLGGDVDAIVSLEEVEGSPEYGAVVQPFPAALGHTDIALAAVD